MRAVTFSFVDQSSSRGLKKFGENIPTIATLGDIRDQSKVVRNREKFWTVFLPSQILGGKPSKNCTQVITPGSRHVVWLKICDDIPISSELIGVYTTNFKPNFTFSRLNFFLGGDPIPIGVFAR